MKTSNNFLEKETNNLSLFFETSFSFNSDEDNSLKVKKKPFDYSSVFSTKSDVKVEKGLISDTNSFKAFNYTVGSFKNDLSNSSENKINLNREDILSKEVTPLLLQTIKEEDFNFGYISKSELIIKEQLEINALATRNWLNVIFVDFFDNELITIGLLRIIGRFNENDIFPQGQTMALAALNHKIPEIKELGIRAFENWSSINSLKILKNIEIGIDWLSEYRDQVIIDLKDELYARS